MSKWANGQGEGARERAGVQACRRAGVQICRFADLQICRFVILNPVEIGSYIFGYYFSSPSFFLTSLFRS
jgi:hypothetical protein